MIKLSKNHSFFIFGPRGSGKSTLLRSDYQTPRTIYIDLLESQTETRYSRNPDLLLQDVKAKKDVDWIIIDEVQKIPKLLDIVHKGIEEFRYKFILTGSSARKLKRGGANLLAGRAFLYYLFPATQSELGELFQIDEILKWGSLPKIFSLDDIEDKKKFLLSYTQAYLKEEILQEQIVRNIDGFRLFLEVAAQMNGKTINYSKIGREAGIDGKTVQSYFQILEDTLIGFYLPAYHKSVRKAQVMQPKFYLFDVGVQRAPEGSLDSVPTPGTSTYGFYFENFLMTEIYRYNIYTQKEFRMSHYQTSTNQEVDLLLSKGRELFAVEMKSTKRIDSVEVAAFARIAKGLKAKRLYYVSQDPIASEIDGVRCLHWQDFIGEVFL